MKNSQKSFILVSLAFLAILLGITSAFNYPQKRAVAPVALSGKWQLRHIEDPYKIVAPPTNVVRLELEFDNNPSAAGLQGAGVRGNVLSGGFAGTAAFDAAATAGELDMGALQVTEDMLLGKYRQFDDYYLQQLARATAYHITQDRLIITTKDKTTLFYTWIGEN